MNFLAEILGVQREKIDRLKRLNPSIHYETLWEIMENNLIEFEKACDYFTRDVEFVVDISKRVKIRKEMHERNIDQLSLPFELHEVGQKKDQRWSIK